MLDHQKYFFFHLALLLIHAFGCLQPVSTRSTTLFRCRTSIAHINSLLRHLTSFPEVAQFANELPEQVKHLNSQLNILKFIR